uniref:Succinate--CoA ligase [ADP-forming] subunit beta, mitochondrial n=1 Tax=Schistosoma japonicum TaxID=6182 RepID=C1L4E9_SCHJA|nr:succinate-Coenzyme A ligase, GDP-forming, beta subunit [Schistosoma japonicum]
MNILNSVVSKNSFVNKTWKRFINLQEFQCKELMSNYGINVQKFIVVRNPSEVNLAKNNFIVEEYVIKAQIPAGGRGMGVFRDGFKGGVHLTKDPNEMAHIVMKMLGNHLVTKQTTSSGILVSQVMVAEALDIRRETYFAILMDRISNSPIMIACSQGGMDIEELAKHCPSTIIKESINVTIGVTDEQACRFANALGFTPQTKLYEETCKQIRNLYKMFTALDCVQIEINPFGETKDGQIVCFDAKLAFDQNAIYRQPEIHKMALEVEDIEVAASGPNSVTALEADAAHNGLNYIGLNDGNIGCIVNGAGLAMATMDLIHYHHGKPANFLDLGGSVTRSQVEKAFCLLSRHSSINCILVNIFGGIVNCKIIAEGLLSALKNNIINIPVVVRLEGNSAVEAQSLISNCGLDLIAATSLEEAASIAVSKAACAHHSVWSYDSVA